MQCSFLISREFDRNVSFTKKVLVTLCLRQICQAKEVNYLFKKGSAGHEGQGSAVYYWQDAKCGVHVIDV